MSICLLLLATNALTQAPVRAYYNIRQVDFRNFTYRVSGFLEQPLDVRLRNGSYVQLEQGRVIYSVKLLSVAVGDLTGDGEDEAAVVLVVSGGGSGFVTEGTVYTLRAGRVVKLSSFEGGEGGHIKSISSTSIRGNVLDVVYSDRSGSSESINYAWNGQRFVQIRGSQQGDKYPDAAQSDNRYWVRIFNCDDNCIARMNDKDIRSTRFGEDSGWIDLTNSLQASTNQIKFLIFNTQGAIAYGFQVRSGEKIVFEEICGQAGRIGCENNKIFPRYSLARAFTYDIILPSTSVEAPLSNSNDKSLIGFIKKEHIFDGCGCEYHFKNDPSLRAIFSDDFQHIWMNIDGQDFRLRRINSVSSPKGNVRRGQRISTTYAAIGISVKIDSVVTKEASDNYEGSDYAGTITVIKGGRRQTANVVGSCGC